MDTSKVKYAKAFVTQYLRRAPQLHHYADDLVQEALMGIMTAGQRFDPTRGAKLSTVEWSWMRAYVSRFAEGSRKHQRERVLGSEGQELLLDRPDTSERHDEQFETEYDRPKFLGEELQALVRKAFRDGARGRALEMARARAAGSTLQEIGAEFGVTKERVRQILEKLAEVAGPR